MGGIIPPIEETPEIIDPIDTPPPGTHTRIRPRKPVWMIWIVVLPVIFALGLGTGYALWGNNTASSEGGVPTVQVPDKVTRYDIPTDGQPSIGPANAKVTIVEFSDYQCPYCKRWNDEVFNRLMKEYPDQVRFVYRDFPLSSIHPQAFPAAEAADCAGEQGDYWSYHQALFGQKYGLSQDAYQKYAADLGLDTAAFAKCISDGRFSDEVTADMNFAANLGISSTPTFFINGIALVGAQPYEVFKQVIDLELAGKIPQN